MTPRTVKARSFVRVVPRAELTKIYVPRANAEHEEGTLQQYRLHTQQSYLIPKQTRNPSRKGLGEIAFSLPRVVTHKHKLFSPGPSMSSCRSTAVGYPVRRQYGKLANSRFFYARKYLLRVFSGLRYRFRTNRWHGQSTVSSHVALKNVKRARLPSKAGLGGILNLERSKIGRFEPARPLTVGI